MTAAIAAAAAIAMTAAIAAAVAVVVRYPIMCCGQQLSLLIDVYLFIGECPNRYHSPSKRAIAARVIHSLTTHYSLLLPDALHTMQDPLFITRHCALPATLYSVRIPIAIPLITSCDKRH